MPRCVVVSVGMSWGCPERGLAGFLWGTPEAFFGSRSRSSGASGSGFRGLTYPADLRVLTGAVCRAD